MAEPTLVALIGYLDRDRKTKEQTHIITMAGRIVGPLSGPTVAIVGSMADPTLGRCASGLWPRRDRLSSSTLPI